MKMSSENQEALQMKMNQMNQQTEHLHSIIQHQKGYIEFISRK